MISPYRIVLADDHVILRQGLKKIIGEMADLEVVGEAGNGLELLSILEKLTPDMVLLDISMPNLRGIEAIHPIPQRHVRRGRLLRLERNDASYGFDDVDRLAPEQQLPSER